MATGAHKMASIDHLHQESLTLKVTDHSDMLSVQYLVNCLEEDHVCHGMTTKSQDLDPRRRLSTPDITQLFFLDSAKNLHTHAVDSAIQLQGNNKVLKERPSPISDEEQRLNRRQWFTFSQLRSGHCHLLQDYKHRVLSNQATSVQTVELHHKMWDTCSLAPHTRLTCHQMIYAGIRWDQFVHLTTSTTGTLTTNLVVANNNNNYTQHTQKGVISLPIKDLLYHNLEHSITAQLNQ